MRKINTRQALNEALREEMQRDNKVYFIGEDIGVYHNGNGPTGVSTGLLAEFGKSRVVETPICEGTLAGSSVGAAMFGMRPVVEIMHSEFLVHCFSYLAYGGSKGAVLFQDKPFPIVFRTPNGGENSGATFQDENVEAWFSHTPGLKVVMPTTPYDAKGLLKAAIRDDYPVLFLEHKALYKQTGEVPEEEYIVPIGEANVRREGKSATVLATGNMVRKAMEAAGNLAGRGIELEIIDLRTLVPLDKETILQSVRKTGRVIICHEGRKTGGYGAEVAAMIAEEAFSYLKAPVARISAPDVPGNFPPGVEELMAAVERICRS